MKQGDCPEPTKHNPESPGWIDPRPPQKIADILGGMSFTPTCNQPEARKQSCALCNLDFVSNPQWFGTRWHYPNICTYCGDNYSHSQEIRNGATATFSGKHLEPRSILDDVLGPKKFHCPKCYKLVRVSPVKNGAYWEYNGRCDGCGSKWVNIYHAYKRKTTEQESTDYYEDPD